MKYNPHDYQTDITMHQLLVPRNGVWAGMGRGKTSATLTTLDILQLERAEPALILAPKRVARSVWPKEIQKWDHLTGEAAVVLGDAATRAAILRGGLRKGNASIYTINYDNIPWLVDFLKDTKTRWPFSTIVADESTKLKGYRTRQGGKRTKALAEVAFLADRFMELTGTPAPNGLTDLWGQSYFLDAGVRLGRSYTAFMNRWFTRGFNGFDYKPTESAQREIEERLADLCLSIKGFDVDEPIVNKIMVDLPPAVRLRYREMERAFYTEIAGQPIEAVHAAAKSQKLLQMATGAVYLEGGKEWAWLHDEKIQALESVVAEAAGMPVLVVYYFKHDLARLKKAFPQGRELDDKQSTEDAWNAGKIPILFVHPQSAGHGLNLQDGGNILCFFSVDWNLEFHDQVIERIGPVRQKQSGHDRPVFLHYILGQDTMDEVVVERLIFKRSVQDALRIALQQRGLI